MKNFLPICYNLVLPDFQENQHTFGTGSWSVRVCVFGKAAYAFNKDASLCPAAARPPPTRDLVWDPRGALTGLKTCNYFTLIDVSFPHPPRLRLVAKGGGGGGGGGVSPPLILLE